MMWMSDIDIRVYFCSHYFTKKNSSLNQSFSTEFQKMINCLQFFEHFATMNCNISTPIIKFYNFITKSSEPATQNLFFVDFSYLGYV